jgi:NAD+ kinase
VVAPHDTLRVNNCSFEEPVDVTVDGRPACLLAAGDQIQVRFVQGQSHLAQVAGTSFYRRLREKFGRLASP